MRECPRYEHFNRQANTPAGRPTLKGSSIKGHRRNPPDGGQATYVRFDASTHATYADRANDALEAERHLDISVGNYGLTDVMRGFSIERTSLEGPRRRHEQCPQRLRHIASCRQRGLVGDKRNLPSSSMASASGVYPGSSRELYELAKAAPFYTDLNRTGILNLYKMVYK